jgi:hypoxanthine phosphoribosyltransferase
MVRRGGSGPAVGGSASPRMGGEGLEGAAGPPQGCPGLGEVLVSRQALAQRVAEMGAEIGRDYAGRPLHLVGVLKGAATFLADLARALPLCDVRVDYLAIASYGPASESSGVVRFVKDLDEPIAGRHVLVVEDIVDTGLTLAYLREHLLARAPASLAIAVMLDKPERRRVAVPVDYVGFRIPDRFVVGYGLDHGGRFRHLPDVVALQPDALG